MGTTPPFKMAAAMPTPTLPPVRAPKGRPRRRTLLASLSAMGGSAAPSTFAPHTPLQALLWRQDWQGVLIRMHLHPKEVRQPLVVRLLDHCHVEALPLHLACALDPPATVVQLILSYYPQAVTLPVKVVLPHTRRRPTWTRRWKAWRLRRRGAFPVPEHHEEQKDEGEQRQSLLPFVAKDDQSQSSGSGSRLDRPEDEQDSVSSESSSLSSRCSWGDADVTNKGLILQLSPSGNVAPLPVNTSNETESTSDSSESCFYRVKWDMQPLWDCVAQGDGMLLPLQIACLFQAQADVLAVLTQAYPLAALSDVLGMLPIHWIAAGWSVPPLLPPPESPVPREPSPGPLPALHVLRRALPESIRVRSGNHSMTPQEYVEECMEETDYKQVCLRVLSDGIDYWADYGSLVSGETIVFVDSDDTSSFGSSVLRRHTLFAGMSGLILDEEWAKAVSVVEEDPSAARKWHYGVDAETVGAMVWKRLPMHLACANGAPVGLIEVLLQAFPEATTVEDPHDGCLPLHIACRAQASLPVIQRLVDACPGTVLAVDGGGRVSLHVAVASQAPYGVLEFLLRQDPESVVAVDQHGRTPMDYAMELYSDGHIITELLTLVLLRLDLS
jgi:hypothetical protein